MDRRALGQRGEQAVAALLEGQGFEIVARNARVGRLELDLIARRRGLLVFCEVKTAHAGSAFGPSERLLAAQRGRLRRAASAWLRTNPAVRASEMRFDAAFVTLREGQEPQIDYYEAAF